MHSSDFEFKKVFGSFVLNIVENHTSMKVNIWVIYGVLYSKYKQKLLVSP